MKKIESSDHMSFEFLELLRKKNPAWRLLVANQAPFIVAFLFQNFIEENKRQIAEHELIRSLDNYIHELNQGREEEFVKRSGWEYLDQWADENHGWLRKFYPSGQDEPYFDITSQAQKAIEWLLSLKEQTFIGTESRLITVFELLQQIVERSETDPELRLAELERRKVEIEQEIIRVRKGQVELLDDTQIKERFWQAATMAREILADFRAVEQNFRDLDRSMREQVAVWEKGKGELLENVFQEQDGISQSEQGKSFAAFWKFLLSSSYQDDFEENLNQVLKLKPVQELKISQNIRYIHNDWVNAGAHVQETVAVLYQQLRRYVDESFLEEERRIQQIVREIEGKAVALRNAPPKEWHMEIDGVSPEFSLPLDRPLFSPPQYPEIKDDSASVGDEDIPTDALFSQIYVDKDRLKNQIDFMLNAHDEVTLFQIIKRYPLEFGLSELVTYMTIASQSNQAFFSDDLEQISWTDEEGNERVGQMPKIIFRRTLSNQEKGEKNELRG